MYKYTIEAYNNYAGHVDIGKIMVVITAANEHMALAKAKQIVDRENYAVVVIEDLNVQGRTTTTIKKG